MGCAHILAEVVLVGYQAHVGMNVFLSCVVGWEVGIGCPGVLIIVDGYITCASFVHQHSTANQYWVEKYPG